MKSIIALKRLFTRNGMKPVGREVWAGVFRSQGGFLRWLWGDEPRENDCRNAFTGHRNGPPALFSWWTGREWGWRLRGRGLQPGLDMGHQGNGKTDGVRRTPASVVICWAV